MLPRIKRSFVNFVCKSSFSSIEIQAHSLSLKSSLFDCQFNQNVSTFRFMT